MTLTAILTPDPQGGYVALNPETGTNTQGESVAEALANLKEATELYWEEFGIESGARPLLTRFEVSNGEAAPSRFGSLSEVRV
jgi:predicted RNase H-like HicB family nuclease